MKQKKVFQVDRERLNKLKTKESTACLDWALKQPNINELQSTIQQMSFIELHLEIENIEMQGVCHILCNNQMQLKFISIANGLLIFQETNCVVLSDCVIQKKKFHCHHNQLFLIIVQNHGGRLILIFQHPMSQKEWFKNLKLSAKQIDFLKKYRIQDNICLNFYSISHKKKKKKFAAQIINRKTFKSYDQQEIVNNYIKILRNTNIQNVFPIISIFDDNDILYLLTDQFIGSSFEQLLSNQKTIVTQADLAFIIFSVLQNLRSLQDEDLFHGNLNLDNIIIVNQSGQLGVYVINPIYKLYKQKQIDYYLNIVPDYLLAPEINENQTPSVCSDVYQLGIILMLVSFYSISQKLNNSFIERVLNNKEILTSQQQIKFQKCQDSDFPYLFSACQLDLIMQMTESDPSKRIQVQDALKHAWFINTKDKIKTQKQNFNRDLPSLKTIIEMVEQSDYDIKRKSLQSTAINFKLPLQKYEFSPYVQQQPELSPLRKTSESLNEVLDEEHQISNLIDQLNNKQYIMLPSQYNHFTQAKSQLRLVQTENNLDQLHI
ncbi:unnamed protein product (macronuclear) [Paramecium tetraurelia]|uniref:Protein kinase domain-containing protein n=1 Tax=Paramecium tetraurelia TaxID=5888 RepID=A0DXL2_PARTE|nr:uncharacterized protein GSPATT00021403001 [Paramecium tetraurelia]CAK87779.1 unnamed protein product [Paramecium tetraurelia]|eukprot:XP_001455176.1 hypothetical protein (macronuclear) [Paramecium tetraurelia strain d4-2]